MSPPRPSPTPTPPPTSPHPETEAQVCTVRRMPRMQVYLPDDLYQALKARGLPASELLQEAVQAELRRLQLLEATDEYIADLEAEVGEPSPDERARAEAIARRIAERAAARQAS
jgi:post-segregation antitoxin (ccd killing protein)